MSEKMKYMIAKVIPWSAMLREANVKNLFIFKTKKSLRVQYDILSAFSLKNTGNVKRNLT